MPDELGRWAAGRAPHLVARAEAEVVETLKRALLEAALARVPRAARSEAKPPAREPVPSGSPAPAGNGLWAYCVTRASDVPSATGVHDAPVERVESEGLAALVSRVPLAEFGEEPLRGNLNDLAWLERVAREHEGVLERMLGHGPLVPLRICTIFADEQGVVRMLDERRAALDAALDALDGRQEWGVKLLVDRATLEALAEERTPPGEELESHGAGGAYMLRRRHERRVREAADRLAVELAEDVHARLQDWASDAVVNAPQNRELSGHEGDMLLNAAYLVETAKVEQLRGLVDELHERHRELGARLELTGPWPPYNFVPRTEPTLA